MALVFWLASAAAVLLGIGVVVARHPIHSAVALVGTLFALAALFLLQNAEFLAVVEVLVYAGAVMVLFLFVITLLTAGKEDVRDIAFWRSGGLAYQVALGGGLGVLLLALLTDLFVRVLPIGPSPALSVVGWGSLKQFGQALFTRYLFPFEMTAVLLLVAVIGVVVLSRERESK